jgi:hypothetical protein
VFIDQLGGFANGVEENGKGIEATYQTTELHPANKVDGDTDILFANLVQENVL